MRGQYHYGDVFSRWVDLAYDIFKPKVIYFGLCNLLEIFVIFTETRKELKKRTIQFLKIVEKHNLCFKQSKCDFNTKKMPILEVEVESFLEFANFYWCLIKNFSHIMKPLNKLKGKKEWKWEEEYQRAFEELKNKITSQPVLTLPKRKEKFRVETNTLGHATGEVLSQEQKEKRKPIAFLSRIM